MIQRKQLLPLKVKTLRFKEYINQKITTLENRTLSNFQFKNLIFKQYFPNFYVRSHKSAGN